MKTTKLVVQSGQYEQSALVVKVRHNTERGLLRRARQLAHKYAVFGDNFAGWLRASVAIASADDVWGDNRIIGGRWCEPKNGWMDL